MTNFQFPKRVAKFFPFFLISLGLILYFHNFLVYPPTRGLDSRDHIAYIKYIAKNLKIPKANEGLQMYQPPFYYALAALLYSLASFLKFTNPLKLSQLISLFSAFGTIILVYLLSKKLFKNYEILILTVLFVVFLPMHIYESSVISNEMLLSFLSTLAFFYFLMNRWDIKNSNKAVTLGVITSLTCLTKYSGLLTFTVIFSFLLINFFLKKVKSYLLNSTVFLLTVLVLSGWFYLRQYLLFGNPLILANDQKLFPYWQEPGYRDLHFYLNLEGLIPLKVFGGPMESFWAGTYNTVWIDVHHTFLPIMEFSRAGALIIYLGLIPTIILFIGLTKALKATFKEKLNTPYSSLLIFSFLSFIFYFYYTYKLPFGSSIKAFYLLNNILPIAVYFGLGMELMIKWLKKYRWILYLEFFTLVLLIYKLYWYQSWWKNIGE